MSTDSLSFRSTSTCLFNQWYGGWRPWVLHVQHVCITCSLPTILILFYFLLSSFSAPLYCLSSLAYLTVVHQKPKLAVFCDFWDLSMFFESRYVGFSILFYYHLSFTFHFLFSLRDTLFNYHLPPNPFYPWTSCWLCYPYTKSCACCPDSCFVHVHHY